MVMIRNEAEPHAVAPEPSAREDALRELAIKQLKKQRDFRGHLLAYVLVNTFLVVLWAVTGTGFFWPVFPMVGWGIWVGMNAWDAYGRVDFGEDRIRREMDRIRRV
jgi:2TM domain